MGWVRAGERFPTSETAVCTVQVFASRGLRVVQAYQESTGASGLFIEDVWAKIDTIDTEYSS